MCDSGFCRWLVNSTISVFARASTSFKPDFSEQINTCSVIKQPATLPDMLSLTIGYHINQNKESFAFVPSCIICRAFFCSGFDEKRLTDTLDASFWLRWNCLKVFSVPILPKLIWRTRRYQFEKTSQNLFAKNNRLWTSSAHVTILLKTNSPKCFSVRIEIIFKNISQFFSLKFRNIAVLLFNSMVLLNLIGNSEIWRFCCFLSLNSVVKHVNVAFSSSIIHHCFLDDSWMFHRWINDV